MKVELSQITFSLTNVCNMSCKHCFYHNENYNLSSENYMNFKNFETFVLNNKENLSSIEAKFFGGEPLLHPEIKRFFELASKYFSGISIFTNGTLIKEREFLENYSDNTYFVINGAAAKNIYEDLSEIQKLKGFNFSFTFPIDYNKYSDNLKLINKVIELFNPDKTTIVVSPDITLDVFNKAIAEKYKIILFECFKAIMPIVSNKGFDFLIDHSLPICFFDPDFMKKLESLNLNYIDGLFGCRRDNSTSCGYLDTDFSIAVCSHNRIKAGQLEINNSLDILKKKLEEVLGNKLTYLSEISFCKDCKVKEICRGGCYLHKLQSLYN